MIQNGHHLHFPHPHRPSRHDILLSLTTMLLGVMLSTAAACGMTRSASPSEAATPNVIATLSAQRQALIDQHPGEPPPVLVYDERTGNAALAPNATPGAYFYPYTRHLPEAPNDWTDAGVGRMEYLDVEGGVRCYRPSDHVEAVSCVRAS